MGLGFGPHARLLPPSLFGEEIRARRNPILPCLSPSVLSVISCSTALLRLRRAIGTGPARSAAMERERRRHSGRYNVAFCDGHVENLKTNALFATDMTVLKRWNYDNEPHPKEL